MGLCAAPSVWYDLGGEGEGLPLLMCELRVGGAEVMEELERVRAGDVFGSSLDLTAGGLQDLPPDTLIPGIAVASTRATPLAGETHLKEY